MSTEISILPVDLDLPRIMGQRSNLIYHHKYTCDSRYSTKREYLLILIYWNPDLESLDLYLDLHETV